MIFSLIGLGKGNPFITLGRQTFLLGFDQLLKFRNYLFSNLSFDIIRVTIFSYNTHYLAGLFFFFFLMFATCLPP